MRTNRIVTQRIALLSVAIVAAHATRQAAESAAERVIQESGVAAGLAVHVGTTDGILEAGLTHGGRMVVHGLALSEAEAAEARRQIFGKKLYGLASISVLKTATTLPYYDRLVNLVVADLDALGLAAPSVTAIDPDFPFCPGPEGSPALDRPAEDFTALARRVAGESRKVTTIRIPC